jgi:hypothetical protein
MRTVTPTPVPGDLSPELASVAAALEKLGKTRADCIRAAQAITYATPDPPPIAQWKSDLLAAGCNVRNDWLERVVVSYAAQDSLPRIDALHVHPAVKLLIRKEFKSFTSPSKQLILVGTDAFVTAIYVATLRRFPAGPIDWVVSGLPRSYFAKMPTTRVPGALWYALVHFGGLKPAFYVHLAYPPRNRSLVIEKEVRRAYYRMARSLILQPEMKGIMCSAWFHDPAALKDAPHLAALNEPYLQHGGRILGSVGEAREDSGFLKFNPERRKLYEEGKLRIHLTLAMWPRAAAIRWSEQHPDLD